VSGGVISAGNALQGEPLLHCFGERLKALERAHHHLELDDAALGAEADDVDALQREFADLGAEFEHRRGPVGRLAVVGEHVEHMHGRDEIFGVIAFPSFGRQRNGEWKRTSSASSSRSAAKSRRATQSCQRATPLAAIDSMFAGRYGREKWRTRED